MPKNSWAVAVAWLLIWGVVPEVGGASIASTPGGTRFIINSWTTDDDLPQNSVTSIIQTRDGYLWFGTLNGLVRFDGLRFTVFDQNNTPGLESSAILSLFEDRGGSVWIGTETGGVALRKEGVVSGVGIGKGYSERRLSAACQDAGGAVWLYTADGQLWHYWEDRFTPFAFGFDRPSVCRALIAEESGPVWIGTDSRLAAIRSSASAGMREPQVDQNVPVGKLDFLLASHGGGYWRLADGRIQKIRAGAAERDFGMYPWGRVPVSAACEDRDGNLVVGTLGGGAFWFGRQGSAQAISTNQGLSHNIVLSLCADRDGNLWVGTDGGGLNRVKRQAFEVLDPVSGFGSAVVQSVCEDDQGGLWIGSSGAGLVLWKDGVMRRFGTSDGLPNSYVGSVFVDRGKQVWVGTKRGGTYLMREGRFESVAGPEAIRQGVSAIHEDRNGSLWLGTQKGLARRQAGEWKVFTTGDGLSSDEVRAIADDPQDNLWIGTKGGGLNCLRDGKFTALHKQDGLPSEDISSLYLDEEGVLWIGTFGGGLGRLQGGRLTRYTTRDGLVSNSIGHLVEDGQGYLWIGSNKGIMRVRKREMNDFAEGLTRFIGVRTYGKPDGLPTGECTFGSQPGACKTRVGALWFPTVKGVVTVDPTRLRVNLHAPPVMVLSALIDGQPQWNNALTAGVPQTLVVPAGKEHLDIYYTSINLSAPDRGRFKYRLEEYETEWVDALNNDVARYPKLPPGHYLFKVKACNEDGIWNEEPGVLAITVEAPFWRTWWFLATTTTLLLAAITAIVRYLSTQKLRRQVERLRQEEALEKERARIARDIHDQLGASLTQMALLSELVHDDREDSEQVRAHSQQISQTARDTTRVLDEIVWAVNPSNDTLDGLMTYACKYAQEYLAVAGLRYRLDVPDQLPPLVMPPDVRHNVFLAFKEAITNVVRHAGATLVRVRLRLEPDGFTLEIQDDGRGLAGMDEQAARSRNGLSNMRKRMEGVGGGFSITTPPEGGALVRLSAPCRMP